MAAVRRLFWSTPQGPELARIAIDNAGQPPYQGEARYVSSDDVSYPPPGGGLLRVPVGGGAAAEMLGTLPGQLVFWNAATARWEPTPTAPTNEQIPQWDAAGGVWRFVPPPNPGALAYFDTTHSPAGLWNFNETLADASGNGNNLVLQAGNAGFADVVPGKKGLFIWVGARYATAAAAAALALTGDCTIEAIVQQDLNPPSTDQCLCTYNGPTEVQADNTLYQFSIVATGAFTNTRNVGSIWEHGAGVNDTYTSAGTPASLGCIHNILFLAWRRSANVVQFFVNGRPFGNASAALTPADGGNGANCRFVVGTNAPNAVAIDQMLMFGLKVIPSALSNAQILAEYNRTMGPAFGTIV